MNNSVQFCNLRVIDILDAWVEADAVGTVPDLMHAVIQGLGMEFVLGILVTRMLGRTVHPGG